MRPSFKVTGMITALVWSLRSADEKYKVGACMLDSRNRVVGVGYNGRAAGGDNCRISPEHGLSGYIHAEINCLLHTNWSGASGHTLFVTHEPCSVCAEAICNTHRVSSVYYMVPYKLKNGVPGHEILQAHGIEAILFNYSETSELLESFKALQRQGVDNLTEMVKMGVLHVLRENQ